jgi:hypothetical protein
VHIYYKDVGSNEILKHGRSFREVGNIQGKVGLVLKPDDTKLFMAFTSDTDSAKDRALIIELDMTTLLATATVSVTLTEANADLDIQELTTSDTTIWALA